MSLRGHPGTAPSAQGPSLESGRHRPLNLRDSTCGARPQSPPGLPPYLQSGGAPWVFFTGVFKWAPRGGPSAQGLSPGLGRCCPFNPRGSACGARPQRPTGLSVHPQSGAAASGRAAASVPTRSREFNPGRHFVFLSPGIRSGRGARSEPAFRDRSPQPAPQDPRVTGRVGTASLARRNCVSYGRMTEGSRALSECDRHLDARSHTPTSQI
ncbi:hypothetical protein NDU88_006671 [Pleurodeles waltl]|uniref:Uncharacterized protein n=1 Tax=Pleurodeles waltl TaxID=8319 RepID=A0AAV7VQJ1_PLEWA|nr:hypothetical protein NDU88_006671 [Pleurodeles waltl]